MLQPRFYVTVRSGYEWNKYNQAHYDADNPPPKTVFGYRFNIFYPRAAKTPTYNIENEKDGSLDTAIIRFEAAPYGRLSFRILNREWDTIEKHGFRSAFDESGLL